jgi:hypothetical protein
LNRDSGRSLLQQELRKIFEQIRNSGRSLTTEDTEKGKRGHRERIVTPEGIAVGGEQQQDF